MDSNEKVKLVPLFCPKCGGNITIKEGQKIVDCGYCDYSFYFDDGIERKEYTHTHIHNHYHYDQEQLESLIDQKNDSQWEKEMFEREHEYEMALLTERRKERRNRLVMFIIIISVITILCLVFKNEISEALGAVGSFLSNAVVWICIFVIIVLAIIL